MDQEEFERKRREIIALLHPEVAEMKNCAEALEMSFEEFLAVLDVAQEDPEHYEHMGANESYRDFNWDLIWAGYELLTGKKAPMSSWGPYRPVPFSCSC